MQRIERFIEIDAPVERVFDLFSDFESFPRWMDNIREVRRTGRGLTHWVSRTALDMDVEWEAETTHFQPDHRIVWRSLRGDVHTDGEAILSVTPEGTTLLRLVIGYDTPSGRSGPELARFFSRHPARQLEEDLARFKRLAEGFNRERRSRELGPRRRTGRLDEREGARRDAGYERRDSRDERRAYAGRRDEEYAGARDDFRREQQADDARRRDTREERERRFEEPRGRDSRGERESMPRHVFERGRDDESRRTRESREFSKRERDESVERERFEPRPRRDGYRDEDDARPRAEQSMRQRERERREPRAREREDEDEQEYRPRYALTPRERERARGAFRDEAHEQRREEFSRRGIDRLMEDPPSARFGRRRGNEGRES